MSKKQFNRLVNACKRKGVETGTYTEYKYFHGNKESVFCDWSIANIGLTKVSEKEFLKLLNK